MQFSNNLSFTKTITAILAATIMSVSTQAAEISHTGSVSLIANHSASADSNLTESWSWAQVSGLTAISGCNSGDEGAGDLTYLAMPDSEEFMEAMLLSAYLSGKKVSVTLDSSSLYQGNCQLKRLAYAADEPLAESVILSLNNQDLDLIYTMDNITGNSLLDDSGQNQNAVLSNSEVQTGVDGNAITFNGTSTEIDTAYKTNGGSYSISMWVFIDPDLTSTATLYGETDVTNISSGARVFLSDGDSLSFGHYKNVGGEYDKTSPHILTKGEWHHIVTTRENGVSHNVYVDGELVSSAPCSDVSSNSTYYGKIGRDYYGGGSAGSSGIRWFQGGVDQFRIFNRAITPSEVTTLFEEFTPQ